MVASVGAGFDLGISNSTGLHPNVHGSMESKAQNRNSFILNRRDAYNSAVRDLFIEPDVDYRNFSSMSGSGHNTYHGHHTKYRPSIQDIPMQFTDRNNLNSSPLELDDDDDEDDDDDDDDDNTSTMKSTSTLIPQSTNPHRLSMGESDDGTITNSSQDDGLLSIHVGLKRQLSESSSDTSRTTVRSNRHSVHFDDLNVSSGRDERIKTSPDTSANSSPYHDTPVAPPRRTKQNGGPKSAERPNTLDLSNSKSGILKSSSTHSSSWESSRESPRTMWVTPSESADHTPYWSTRSSGMSPGNTPPHILHQKTLLDIDMEGQTMDVTQPLLQPKSQYSRPSVQEIKKVFTERL